MTTMSGSFVTRVVARIKSINWDCLKIDIVSFGGDVIRHVWLMLATFP